MMQSAGIVVNDVTVTWRNGHTALRDASFTVPGGSIAALVGVNGSGKSTLFKAIMGFVRLTSGKISVLGIPTRQALQKNLVAYVPQSEEVDWSFPGHCCKVSDEAAFCLIQRPYISKTLLTRRISPRGSP